jgi:protein-histidine pros-kinase
VQALLDLLPDAAVLVDDEGRIVYVNAEADALFGYAHSELIGQPVEALMPHRFNQRHVEQRRQYTHQPHRRKMGEGLGLWGRRKDGTEFPVDIALGPVQLDGTLLILAVVRDMTERKQIETALKREMDAVQKMNQTMMGREERVLELKRQVNALLKELGRPPQYQA